MKDLMKPEELARIFGVPAKLITHNGHFSYDRYTKMRDGWNKRAVFITPTKVPLKIDEEDGKRWSK